jgi:hypothetical protein
MHPSWLELPARLSEQRRIVGKRKNICRIVGRRKNIFRSEERKDRAAIRRRSKSVGAILAARWS